MSCQSLFPFPILLSACGDSKTALRRGIFQLEQAPRVPISQVALSSLRKPQSRRRQLQGRNGFPTRSLTQVKRRSHSESIRSGAFLSLLSSRAVECLVGLVSSTGKFPDLSRQLP